MNRWLVLDCCTKRSNVPCRGECYRVVSELLSQIPVVIWHCEREPRFID